MWNRHSVLRLLNRAMSKRIGEIQNEKSIEIPDPKKKKLVIENQTKNELKIVCWNVAGFRAIIKKGLLEYIDAENPDILCFLETKANLNDLSEINKYNINQTKMSTNQTPSYHILSYIGKKPGYCGVSVWSKEKPLNVLYGIQNENFDEESRVITVEYSNFYLLAVYVPNAGDKLKRLEYRLKWDEQFRNFIKQLNSSKKIVICGDLNVAHKEIDLAHPKTNLRSAGFTIEERQSFDCLLELGFTDIFRHFNPNLKNAYTYWSYRRDARAKNVGW